MCWSSDFTSYFSTIGLQRSRYSKALFSIYECSHQGGEEAFLAQAPILEFLREKKEAKFSWWICDKTSVSFMWDLAFPSINELETLTGLGLGPESEAVTLGFSSPDLEFCSYRDKIYTKSLHIDLISTNMWLSIYCHRFLFLTTFCPCILWKLYTFCLWKLVWQAGLCYSLTSLVPGIIPWKADSCVR